MQETGEAVAEIEPMEQANFEQRVIDQAIQVAFVGEQASVEPYVVATLDAITDEFHLIVKAPELGHPHVAVLLQLFRYVGSIHGIHGEHPGQIAMHELGDASVVRWLAAMGFIKNVLEVN